MFKKKHKTEEEKTAKLTGIARSLSIHAYMIGKEAEKFPDRAKDLKDISKDIYAIYDRLLDIISEEL